MGRNFWSVLKGFLECNKKRYICRFLVYNKNVKRKVFESVTKTLHRKFFEGVTKTLHGKGFLGV